jgi:lysophospholipase L1-like esterase
MPVWRITDTFMTTSHNDVFVFVGDSITDAGRRDDPEQLGDGYVRMFADLMAIHQPQSRIAVRNRGIGGDTIRHLARRWDEDVLREAPSYLAISIGVNDVWRHLQTPPSPEAVPVEEFEATYRDLLARTRRQLSSCRVLLLEPTVIGEEPDSAHNRMMPPYLDVVHILAREFNAVLVPMNQAFWDMKRANPAQRWTTDGVHPLSRGHLLMAQTLWRCWESLS